MRALRFTFSLLLAAVLLGLGAWLFGLGGATASATAPVAGWAPTGGPMVDGGKAVALAAHPSQIDTLYAAVGVASDGAVPVIYRTADGAAHWTPIYSPTWDGVGAVAAAGNAIYVAGSGQAQQQPLAFSQDSGASWQKIMPVFPGHNYEDLRAAAISPQTPTELFAAGQYQTDNLNWAVIYRVRLQPPAPPEWTPVLTVPGNQREHGFYTIVTDPATPGLVIAAGGLISDTAGTRQAAIYRSTDAGDTWTRTYLGEELPFISLLVDPTQPGLVFAGTADWYGQAATIWRSTDAGQNWAQVATGAGHGLAFVAPGTIYAMADQGHLMRSTAGGAAGTWSDVGNQGDANGLLAASGAALYAGGHNRGVFKSSDGGQNWGQASGGLRSPVYPVSFAVDPQAAGWLMVAAGGAGGFRTTDGGANWTQPPSLNGHVVNTLVLKPGSAPQVVYEGASHNREGAVRRSSDGGLTFTQVYISPVVKPDASGGQEEIDTLAASPAPNNIVYAGGKFWGGGYGQTAVILRSAGDGLAGTWTTVFTSSDSSVQALALDPHDANIVYAGGQQCLSGACKGFVQRTRDGGLTWSAVLTPDQNVRSFAIDPRQTHVVYAATDGYQVFKSIDGGDTWTVVRNPPWMGGDVSGSRLAIDLSVPSHLYLAGWSWVGESTDGGLTWSDGSAPMSQGMPGMDPRALALRTDGEGMQTFYAGLGGVWSLTRPAPQVWSVYLPVTLRAR